METLSNESNESNDANGYQPWIQSSTFQSNTLIAKQCNFQNSLIQNEEAYIKTKLGTWEQLRDGYHGSVHWTNLPKKTCVGFKGFLIPWFRLDPTKRVHFFEADIFEIDETEADDVPQVDEMSVEIDD